MACFTSWRISSTDEMLSMSERMIEVCVLRFKQGANDVEALFGSDAFLQTLRILGAEGAVEVTYGKRDNDGRSLETLIEDSEGKHRMRMRLRDIRGAETFPDKVFKIRLPQGVEKIAL